MIRIKTLSLPLISALVASTITTATAQVELQLNSEKTYRQSKKGIYFKGGTFKVRLDDGHVSTIGFCDDPNYYPPGRYINACSPGTSGFLSMGNLDNADVQRPYLVITELQDAIAIAPLYEDKIKLLAAPASGLPRPSGGFGDDSSAVYYNLHTTNVREYGITGYFLNRKYTKNQRDKFEREIVPGAYRYSFPRLNNPDMPAPITAVIYPMLEGKAKKNNRVSGFEFTKVNKNKWTDGYVELSYLKPNSYNWAGLTPNVVFANVDRLYFSLRALRNPAKPDSSDVFRDTSIFPAFTNSAGDNPRVLLSNPYVKSFITPPIIPSGTRAIAELELQRGFQTGGVTYDLSNRKFQIPVAVFDRYTEFVSLYLSKASKKNKGILEDPDKDGYNNLTEWILESEPSSAASIPAAPQPAPYQAVDIIGGPTPFGSYYGFNVDIKEGTVPKVTTTLQRSKDQGKTWENFVDGYYYANGSYTDLNDPPEETLTFPYLPVPGVDWQVQTVRTNIRGISRVQVQVRSMTHIDVNIDNYLDEDNWYYQPPGATGHIYRVKVTLPNKK
ncbi:hypothetical protein JIN84_11080 [Luteolibacter yonseiensis]|uniref:Uncharacterized protein n=1 Tax=Luteolibacter yonseiensis TaxID=1144680 RepID=A0A934V7H9_9BACT|nr:hypothetical protein [Luteolibacter yonseiensis]MBK1816157.1 hypothetical protein [Luteolibacter yonseiensis]